MKNILLLLSLVFVQTAFTFDSAEAVTITVTELIEDTDPLDLFSRDLRRTRTDSNGFLQFVNNDATIISENSVDGDFGIYNFLDVSFRHVISWINPLASSFIGLSLEIKAYGVDGGNEVSFADNINLGALINDGSILENTTTTIFTNNNVAVLNAILIDGILSISIDKNSGANGLNLLDNSSIYSSKLTVQYSPVPEPMTLVLLASSILELGLRRKRA